MYYLQFILKIFYILLIFYKSFLKNTTFDIFFANIVHKSQEISQIFHVTQDDMWICT